MSSAQLRLHDQQGELDLAVQRAELLEELLAGKRQQLQEASRREGDLRAQVNSLG